MSSYDNVIPLRPRNSPPEDLPVPVPPEQSANIIAMLDGLYASAASGREATIEPFESV